MSDSYTKAVEELRLLMGNTKGREDHFKIDTHSETVMNLKLIEMMK